MNLKHRLPESETSIGPATLYAAADEYSGLPPTLCLCMEMVDSTRANVRTCASELKRRLTIWYSHKELNAILFSWDPAGYVLDLRHEANDNAHATGDLIDVFT